MYNERNLKEGKAVKNLITYQRAAEALGITVQALRNKVSAMGMELAKQGNRAYFTPKQLKALGGGEGTGQAFFILPAAAIQEFSEAIQDRIKAASL